MSRLFKLVLGSIVGRWVTASLIALLLGGGAWKWHNFKDKLVTKGQQVCAQEINKQTVIDLENALAAERLVAADLRAKADAAATVNQEARARLRESESRVASLLTERKEQEKTDETYKAWSDTPLPSGVADRVRDAASASDPDTGN